MAEQPEITVPVDRLTDLRPGDRIVAIDGCAMGYLRLAVDSVDDEGTRVSCTEVSALALKGHKPHVMNLDLHAATPERPRGRIRESVTVLRREK